jgi:hypothetical protein
VSFCAGTVYNCAEGHEPNKGRLLIFSAESQGPSLHVKLVASEDVQGCVYALAGVNGFIAAAINASVSSLIDIRILTMSAIITSLSGGFVFFGGHTYEVRSLA